MITKLVENKKGIPVLLYIDDDFDKIEIDIIFQKCGNITESKKLVGISHLIEHIIWYTIDPKLDNNAYTTGFTTGYSVSGNKFKDLIGLLKERLFRLDGKFIAYNIDKILESININNILLEISNEFYFRIVRSLCNVDYLSVYSVDSSYPGGIYIDLGKSPNLKNNIISVIKSRYVAENMVITIQAPQKLIDKKNIDILIQFVNSFPTYSDINNIEYKQPILSNILDNKWNLMSVTNVDILYTPIPTTVITLIIENQDHYIDEYGVLCGILDMYNTMLSSNGLNITASVVNPANNIIIMWVEIFSGIRFEKLYVILYEYLSFLLKNVKQLEDIVKSYKKLKTVDYFNRGNLYRPDDDFYTSVKSVNTFKNVLEYIVEKYYDISSILTNSYIFESEYLHKDIFGSVIKCKKINIKDITGIPPTKYAIPSTYKNLNYRYDKNEYSKDLSAVDSENEIIVNYNDTNGSFTFRHTKSHRQYLIINFKYVDGYTLRIINYIINTLILYFPSVRINIKSLLNFYKLSLYGETVMDCMKFILTRLGNLYDIEVLGHCNENCATVQDLIYKRLYNIKYRDSQVCINILKWDIYIYCDSDYNEVKEITDQFNLKVNKYKKTNIINFKFDNKFNKFDSDVSIVLLFTDSIIPHDEINNLKDRGFFYSHEKYIVESAENSKFYIYLILSINIPKLLDAIKVILNNNISKYSVAYSISKIVVY